MFTYQDYLNFNTVIDAEKQTETFERIQLSYRTLIALEKLKIPHQWIILAEPFCPDCQVFVPIVEKMARNNSLLQIHYIPRFELENTKYFNNVKQQQLIKKTYSIPSAFEVAEKTTLIYQEFPTIVKERMHQSLDNYQMLRYAYREGAFTDVIEEQLINFIKKKQLIIKG